MVLYFLHLGKKSRFYKVIHCVFPMSFRNKHKHYFLHDNITPPRKYFFSCMRKIELTFNHYQCDKVTYVKTLNSQIKSHQFR